jgi:hypothetical protein
MSTKFSKYEVTESGKIRKSYYDFNESVVYWVVFAMIAASLVII